MSTNTPAFRLARLPACILLAISGQVAAHSVSDVSGYNAALAAINGGDPDKVIHVNPGTISLVTTPIGLPINVADVVLEGNNPLSGSAISILDGAGAARLFGSNQNVQTIRNLRLQKGYASGTGGAVNIIGPSGLNNGLFNLHFDRNTATNGGGAVYIGRDLNGGINVSAFTGNTATSGDGGALLLGGGLSGGIRNSFFSDNKASSNGGAVLITDDLDGGISDTDFKGNKTTNGHGGAVFVNNNLNDGIQNSRFIDNEAGGNGDGGAIRIAGDLNGGISGTEFKGNKTTNGDGGAVVVNGMVNGGIQNSRFIGNKAGGVGGALLLEGNLNGGISNTDFRLNQATYDGGALYTYVTSLGGGIQNSRFIENTAGGRGGAADLDNDLSITDSAFLGNQAGGKGGALYHNSGGASTVTLSASAGKRTLFYGNQAAGINNAIHFGRLVSGATTTLDIHASGDVLILDALSKESDVTLNVNKSGEGVWYLGGNNQLTGTTAGTWNIHQGSLVLTNVGGTDAAVDLGSGSAFHLHQGATLGGSGSIKADSIHLDGNIALENANIAAYTANPGITQAQIDAFHVSDSGGFRTLTLNGATTFGANSVYELRVGATSAYHDQINITGVATVDPDATIKLKLQPGADWGKISKDESVTHIGVIAASDGLTMPKIEGTLFFEAVDSGSVLPSTGAPATPAPAITLNDAQAASTPTSINIDIVRSANFSDYGSTYNQRSVGSMLDDLDSADPLVNELLSFEDVSELQSAYDSLSGDIYASTRSALIGNSHLRQLMNRRALDQGNLQLAATPAYVASTEWGSGNAGTPHSSQLWVGTWHSSGTLEGNSIKADQRSNGVAVGAEHLFSPQLMAGIVLAAEDGEVKNDRKINRSRANVDSYSLGTYLGLELPAGFSLRSGLAYSKIDLDSQRTVNVSGLQSRNKASVDGKKTQLFVEGSKDIPVGESLAVSPYLNLTQNWLHTDSAQEKASGSAAPGSALRIKGENDSLLQSTLGMRTRWSGHYDATPVALDLDLGWMHSSGDNLATTHNQMQAVDFKAKGAGLNRNMAVTGANVEARIAENLTVGLGYQGQFGSDYKDHLGQLQLKFQF